MSRFSNLFKNFVSSEDEIPTPSFIKPKDSSAKASKTSDLPIPNILVTPAPAAPAPEPKIEVSRPITTVPAATLPSSAELKSVVVPVYESDGEWDVVQRTISAFAERVRVSADSKQAFVKKWIAVLERTGQKSLYRADGEENSGNHLGNKINRAAANPATRQLGTYEAVIDPVKEAGMMYDLQALRQMELSFFTISNAELSRAVKNDLRSIILGSTAEQTEGAKSLLAKVQSGQPEAEKIYVATKQLANSNEMRLNATLKSTVLKMDANKYQQLGMNGAKTEETKIPLRTGMSSTPPLKSDKKAALPNSRENAKLTDSDWVNKQALDLFGDLERK
jgi:hypothetical protein